jgi:N4-gp56 family major capsid protein
MADMGLTEVAATVQETVSSMVQEYLIQEAVLMPLVMNIPSMPGEDRVKIPRSGDDFTADTKAENTSLTAQTLLYTTDDLLLDKHKAVQVRVEDRADVQSMINLLNDIVPRMVKTLALDIDTSIVAQLVQASAAAPDHRLAYANTTSLGKSDLLAARVLIHQQNLKFNECYIGVSPASESDLLAIDDFVHVDKYGANATGLNNGELGRLYGARVIMSNEFADNATVIWHPSACAFSRQVNPKFEDDRDLPNLATLYSLSHLYGTVVLDSGVRQVLLGSAT